MRLFFFVTVPPGSPCAKNIVCGGESACFNGFCTCPAGDVIRDNHCIPAKSSGVKSDRNLAFLVADPFGLQVLSGFFLHAQFILILLRLYLFIVRQHF